MISDACGPEMEPRAIVHVEYPRPFGMLCLSNPVIRFNTDEKIPALRLVHCMIQYFNDSDDPREPDPLGSMLELEMTLLFKERPLITPICDHITEPEFGTHLAFETFPVLQTRPHNKTLLKRKFSSK